MSLPLEQSSRTATTPLAFEQQPKESSKAFAAFSLYLGLGSERSIEIVRLKLGKSSRLIQKWSSRWRWAERLRAYELHMAAIEREATEALARRTATERAKRREVIQEEEWELHDDLIRAGRQTLKRFQDGGKGATLGDIVRAFELASRLGRLASGLATEKAEVTGEDGGPIRVELSVALEKIYGQAQLGSSHGDVVDVEAKPVAEGTK